MDGKKISYWDRMDFMSNFKGLEYFETGILKIENCLCLTMLSLG